MSGMRSSSLDVNNLPRATAAVGILNEKDVIRSAGKEVIDEFLNAHNCFEVIRQSGKVVVFDTKIPIQLAFYALVEHGTFCYSLLGTFIGLG